MQQKRGSKPSNPPSVSNGLPALWSKDVLSIHDLRQSGLPIEAILYAAIGAGLGSFIWINYLRICGVPTSDIVAIGFEAKPHSHYQRLCLNSQIPDHERLRSDSQSCPGNLWGWPGYGVREAWQALWQGKFKLALLILWQLFAEPVLAQTYTPRSGAVFAEIEREASRIGWEQMFRQGRVKAIRKTDDGRYAILYSSLDEAQGHRVIVAHYVHLAVGYPAIKLLPDLYDYRQKYADFKKVVNAYERHDHIYEHLEKRGGSVMVRGRGIVASRIIQRVYEARQVNPNITILHLMQSPTAAGHRFGYAQRQVVDHWELQAFNWPKACWSGELRYLLEQADEQQRKHLLELWGGTTTADRHDWRQIISEGLREGWHDRKFGQVLSVEPDAHSNKVTTCILDKGAVQGEVRLSTDYIIDATGLISELDSNPLLKDLFARYQLERNALGRIKVSNDFEMVGMRNQNARMYASGVMTLGGPYAAVDSFLGLQFAALRAVDSLVAAGAPGLYYLDGWRSVVQWLRWARGARP
jgi:pSer/pThr/pTyr-binding forkhead associated (FHA) protein